MTLLTTQQCKELSSRSLLMKIRHLKEVLTEKNWLKASLSQDSEGKKVSTLSESACKFCLIGGIAAVEGLNIKNQYEPAGDSDTGKLVAAVIYGHTIKNPMTSRFSSNAQKIYSFNDANEVSFPVMRSILDEAEVWAKASGV